MLILKSGPPKPSSMPQPPRPLPALKRLNALEDSRKSRDKSTATHAKNSKILLDRDEVEGLLVKAPAYDCKFQQVVLEINTLIDNLYKAVPEDLHDHPIFMHLVMQIRKAATCPEAAKRIINIIGKSGAGKSSLLNCLLGLANFAKADIATGCTTIPTSHEAPFDAQELDFAARIEFFSINVIRQQLKSMWHDYYAWNFEDDKSDWTEEDKQDARQSAQTASDALFSLFRGKIKDVVADKANAKAIGESQRKDDFSDVANAKATLKALRKKDVSDVVAPWVEWCREILPEDFERNPDREKAGFGDEIPVLMFQASTQEELRGQLDTYAYPDQRKASFWPLVDTIRIGLRNVAILKYITLVDWPGVGDTNDIRGKSSTGRVSVCDEVWVVSDPNRICTDPAIWRSVSRFAGFRPCSIICTKVDEKCDDFTDMEKIMNEGYDMGNLEELRESERDKVEQVEQLKTTLSELLDKFGPGYSAMPNHKRQRISQDDQAEYESLLPEVHRELIKLEREFKETEHARRLLVVTIRNRWLRDELRKEISKQGLAAHSIKIFFASSRHYMAHKGVETWKGAKLPLADTGIPELRQHILLEASPDIVTSAKQYISGIVKVALEGVALSIAPHELEGCVDVLKHIGKKPERCVQTQQSYTATIENATAERFLHPINGRNGKRQQLVGAAIKIIELLRSWHHMSLKAFIRKDGDWASLTQKAQRWNEKFAKKLGEIVLENWAGFEDVRSEAFVTFEAFLMNELDDIRQLGNQRGAYKRLRDQGGRFKDFIESQKDQLRNKCANAAREHASTMIGIKLDATKTGCRASKGYFDFAMGDTYAEARGIKGKGYSKTVMNHFETKLKSRGKDSPFISAAHYLKDAAESAAENQAQIAADAFRECITDIEGWLRAVFVERGSVEGIYGALVALKNAQELGKKKLAECEFRLQMVDEEYAAEEKEAKRLEKNRKERERNANKARLVELARAAEA